VSEFKSKSSRKATFITLTTMVLLLFAGYSVFLFSNVTTNTIELTVVGEDMKIIEPGETARYPIKIENKGSVDAEVKLKPFNTPEGWTAELSSDEEWIDARDAKMVFLSVTAPSSPTRSMARVAEIGVRAGNVTIGTITILKGSATLTRDGDTTALGSGDDILSGDIVSTSGESVIAIDPNKLINASTTYTDNIYVLLSDATVGFLRWQDTAYMVVISGEVSIWVPGGGGIGRAPPQSPVINLSEMGLIDTEFPDLEYNVVMEFGSFDESSFFHLDVNEDNTTVEVFEGEVTVGTEESTRALTKFEQTTAVRTVEVPEPQAVRRSIISLESDDSVKGVVESQGRNVLDLPDVHYMPMENVEFYVTPVLPELTVDLDGMKEGEYTVDITQITNFTGKTFGVRTTATENTTDDLIFEEETLKFKEMEKDKTYNLTIRYEDATTGEESEFEVVEVKTSEKEQSVAVDDWEKLDETEEKPVTFAEGDKKVKVKEGATGEEIEEMLEEEEDEKEFPLVVTALSVVIVLLIVILFTMNYWYPLLEKREKAQKNRQGLEDSGEDEPDGK